MKKQIFSMTGFGRGTAGAEGLEANVELRSINGRFLEVRVRLPRAWAELEAKIREEISKNFHRGTIDVIVSLEGMGAAPAVKADRKLAESYAQTIRSLARELGTDSEISALSLLRLPGVLHENNGKLGEAEMSTILSAVTAAISDAKSMRASEGERALRALEKETDELAAAHGRVSAETQTINGEISARLKEKLEKILGSVDVDHARLVQEVGFYVERGDVTEELDRLKNHLAQFRDDLANTRPLGKRLDFLVQEMSREVNTLGAKSTKLGVIRDVMEMKLILDRIKEQVQNLE